MVNVIVSRSFPLIHYNTLKGQHVGFRMYWQMWNTVLITMFSLVYNHLKVSVCRYEGQTNIFNEKHIQKILVRILKVQFQHLNSKQQPGPTSRHVRPVHVTLISLLSETL